MQRACPTRMQISFNACPGRPNERSRWRVAHTRCKLGRPLRNSRPTTAADQDLARVTPAAPTLEMHGREPARPSGDLVSGVLLGRRYHVGDLLGRGAVGA